MKCGRKLWDRTSVELVNLRKPVSYRVYIYFYICMFVLFMAFWPKQRETERNSMCFRWRVRDNMYDSVRWIQC
jgi:hypothetical protein